VCGRDVEKEWLLRATRLASPEEQHVNPRPAARAHQPHACMLNTPGCMLDKRTHDLMRSGNTGLRSMDSEPQMLVFHPQTLFQLRDALTIIRRVGHNL
jgi:hypothetical protein